MKNKKVTLMSLVLMGFTVVWGFGNIINGFYNYNGLHSIVPWFIVLLLYFLPYVLMVGELGTTFADDGGGVSSWIKRTFGNKFAYFTGWIYWVVHMPYMSQKPNSIVIATGWAFAGRDVASELGVFTVQIISLIIFIIALILATRGLRIISKIASIAGMASFIMMILYVVMMWTAPLINENIRFVNFNIESFKPIFSKEFFLNFSILILAVGGCEKIATYVNYMDNPQKDFSKSMIVLVLMVAFAAVFGTIAVGMMFDSNNIPDDLMMNGAYYAFKKLGEYYNLGNFFLVIYAVANILANMAVLVLSIDAPLRILLDNTEGNFIPTWLSNKDDNGIYMNGIKMVGVIVGTLIVLPIVGIGNINQLAKWLVKLNSVCMPLHYLPVFVAYIGLKINKNKNKMGDYIFVKNKYMGVLVGWWCFLLTFISCIMGMYSKDRFEFIMNVLTPIILVVLGIIMPLLTKMERRKVK